MKVLIAVHHFPPHYTGGAELRAYRTAAWLRDHGHDVYVVCVEAIDSTDGNGLTFEDDTYDGLPVRRLRFNLTIAPDPFRWRYDNPWIGEHLGGYLNGLAPDLLHLISGYLISGSPLRAASDLGIPTVVTLTDFWFLCPRTILVHSNGQLCAPPLDAVTCARCLGEAKRRYRIPGRIAPGLMRAFWRVQQGRVEKIRARMSFLIDTLNSVDAIISPSHFLRDFFVEAGIEPRRIFYSRQGCDLPDLPLGAAGRTSHLRIGYMGQIASHKGVHVLFEAVRQMPDLALMVKAYGDGSHFPSYARRLRRIARADERLSLAGVYERTEVSRVLRELDVVVVPSVCYENSPNTILEAFAAKVPVVASNLGGMAELVKHEVNGLLFSVGNADDLADQLQRLVNDAELLPRLRAGISPVKGIEQEMQELVEIYRQAFSKQAIKELN